ncbi:bifunctional 2-keto-4-hydroxyglutarate aldolase/2-keto-3-deoxy-6-phosphogluconate aldolase [Ethanoligenens sp.]|uniref:bifunctional 2-keto-4-hydroxyglutarate aldolase/2-keto-3-deoxy-6-phosphogluconate aldolase n=1 Tax=Ethanoligenens sp. TaxID=2099655 RepID=UPI0039E77DF1
MSKHETLERIRQTGVVAVIRAGSFEQGMHLVEAVKKGGIQAIEVTMTVPGAIDLIHQLVQTYGNEELLVGAGTVLDPETARYSILAGAQYVVSPSLQIDTLKLCNRYAIACIPGVMTVEESIRALEYGAEILKLFPGGAFGPSIIRAFKGPLPQAEFMPTGGVNLENIKEWVRAGAIAVGAGGDLTKGAETGDYARVTETAAQFIKEINHARAAYTQTYPVPMHA